MTSLSATWWAIADVIKWRYYLGECQEKKPRTVSRDWSRCRWPMCGTGRPSPTAGSDFWDQHSVALVFAAFAFGLTLSFGLVLLLCKCLETGRRRPRPPASNERAPAAVVVVVPADQHSRALLQPAERDRTTRWRDKLVELLLLPTWLDFRRRELAAAWTRTRQRRRNDFNIAGSNVLSSTHSFFPGLKPSFSVNPSHCSPSFLLLKYLLCGFSGLFYCYFWAYLFSTLLVFFCFFTF